MLRRTGAGMPMPLFSLQPRSQAHPAPFRFVQLAVAIAVEALQQAGVFTLPFADHLLSGGRQVQPLAAASRRAEITDGVKRFVGVQTDRKSTRLNSSHVKISYAVFC